MEWLDNNNDSKSENNISVNNYFKKGNDLGKLGRYQEAIDWYDKALEVDLKHINSLNKKGDALTNLGKFDEAEKCFERAWAIQHHDTHSCQACKNENPPDSEYCKNCGNKFLSICSTCKKSNPFGASFCNTCGFILK